MEQGIYEDPGQFRSEPPPPPQHLYSSTTARQFTTVTVEGRANRASTAAQANSASTAAQANSASTAAPDPFSCHFQDTFTEAAEPKVPEVIHNCYRLTYSIVLNFFYVFLSVLIGPILVVIFGLVLGLTSFTISWVLSPIFRCCGMCFVVWEGFITSYLNCCVAPYCRVLGGCCSRMVLRYQKVPPGEVINI